MVSLPAVKTYWMLPRWRGAKALSVGARAVGPLISINCLRPWVARDLNPAVRNLMMKGRGAQLPQLSAAFTILYVGGHLCTIGCQRPHFIKYVRIH